MKSQQTISETSQVIKIDEQKKNKREHFRKLGLTISLATFSIGFSIYTGSARAGIEDIQLYYRYVPYQGPGSSASSGQQPGKQSSGASGAEVKKNEQAPSQAGKTETATPPAKQETAPQKAEEAKKPQTSEQAGKPSESTATPSTSESSSAKMGGQEPTGTTGPTGQAQVPGGQEAVPCPHSQQSGAKVEGAMSGEQKPSTEQKYNPVGKPSRDTGEFPSGDIPSFCQVDVNKDHYITKDELQNFPDLLRIFDKVDAGKDGRLEQHEFQNLEMEAKREGEIM